MRKIIKISETGDNHNDSLDFAKTFISKLAQAGADYETF